MENLGLTHELENTQERQLDGLIKEWGLDVQAAWVERYGEEVLGDHGRVSQFWRTTLITVCRVREARAAAHNAQLENAYYGNRAPGITDTELAAYTSQRDSSVA